MRRGARFALLQRILVGRPLRPIYDSCVDINHACVDRCVSGAKEELGE